MNIINKLTLNHMKRNKKRTIVTIIGVAIAVALITATITIVTSFIDFMKRDEIAQSGYWHVEYKNVSREQIDKIRNDENTEQIMLTREIGFSTLKEIDNKNRPYIFVKEYDNQGFENNNVKVIKGRLPKNKNEIVLSEDVFNNKQFKYAIGNTLNLDLGKRYFNDKTDAKGKEIGWETQFESGMETLVPSVKKEYKIVGIIKKSKVTYNMSGYKAYSYFDESSNIETNALVVLKNLNTSTFSNIENFAKENKIKDYVENRMLLTFSGAYNSEGNFASTLVSILILVLGIISIGSIALIYNAFSISVSERSKYLGILSSVGATKNQKRKSVLFEALIIFLFSTPIGILIGLLGMGITFIFVNNILGGIGSPLGHEGLKLSVNYISILLILIFSFITVFISAIIPAIKASRTTAIEAIRQSKDIKINNKRIKTSKITRRVFGIEGDIALKNLKRNKSKYLVTIFSLIISIVLFISVSFFGDILKKSVSMYSKGIDYDIEISESKLGTFNKDDIEKEFNPVINKADEYSINSEIYVVIPVENSKVPDYITNEFQVINNKKAIDARVISLNTEIFNKYVKEIGGNPEDFSSEGKISGIYIDTLNYYDNSGSKYTEKKSIGFEKGDTLQTGAMYNEKQFKETSKVEIKKLTNKIPMGISKPSDSSPITIIVCEKDMNKLVENNKKVFGEEFSGKVRTSLYIRSQDPMKLQEDIDLVKEKSSTDFNIDNLTKVKESQEKVLLVVSIFLYGFIALITIVSTANIFNTISTSIMLRRKEFAMLKSVGMSEKSFNKMINYESIFYGLKSLLYGLPLGLGVTGLLYMLMSEGFDTSYNAPWKSIIIVSIGVLLIVGISMFYASSKLKKESIIDALKQDNI